MVNAYGLNMHLLLVVWLYISAQEAFAFLIDANAEQLDEHLPNYFKCLFCYIVTYFKI